MLLRGECPYDVRGMLKSNAALAEWLRISLFRWRLAELVETLNSQFFEFFF
jgi:hypothetical protein